MTIKDFRGQVKVEDIQNAFNEIVNRINTMVDTYNDAAGYSDIDYTKGSAKLASSGYTLTIGGLKSILDSYNGTLVGCKVYKLSDTSVLVSDGLYIKSDAVYRINSQVVSGNADWDLSELYYDIDNDAVMFKEGSSGTIVDVQTAWTQPSITSNTSYGIFTANYNSSYAFNATTSTGWSMSYSSAFGGQVANPAVTWDLPKPIKCSNISFITNVNNICGTGNIVVYINGELSYTGSATGSHSIALNDKEVNSITIAYTVSGGIAFSVNISNLLLTGTSSSIAIDSGGVITPSDNIIRICNLNWASDDLVLTGIENLQLENVAGVNITSQNRSIGVQGWESIDTSNSGKFVAYTTRIATGRGNLQGSTNFMDLNINYAYDGGDSPYRGHWIATALSLIYIPRGFTLNDSYSGTGSRWVFNSTLNK